ncbi:rhodanese-related sulfurtransferase [Proteiniclasticum sp.]|uniref:oxygen-dependent tRNA uridine(34) hydroxylase TrhO n=1 Tax=Proteiniclasticum sp. TaxID=2053595 RepID=UPI00289A9367|nr:rhodanese-related sulfurtransferase [Proteiniclasticum sp.]
MSKMNYRVLLYYKFTSIDDPVHYADEHKAFCRELGLKGRILVAEEGINGTLSGTFEATQAYMDHMKSDERFKDMVFKIHVEEQNAFRKLYVKARESIITLNEDDDVDPNEKVGTYLKPKEWYDMLQRDDVIILDGRNGYEYDIGHFRGAVRPDITNFKEFPKWIEENLSEHKDKKVIAYCTGGIRCEKLTGVLLNQGFKDVYHLEGGIVTYGQDEETKGKLWDGKCYVFDDRISVKINQEEDVIVSHCVHCGVKTDRYINCTNDDCHLQHISCEACEKEHEGFCSVACKNYIAENPSRDARIRLKEKAELYRKYGQKHRKAEEAFERLQENRVG